LTSGGFVFGVSKRDSYVISPSGGAGFKGLGCYTAEFVVVEEDGAFEDGVVREGVGAGVGSDGEDFDVEQERVGQATKVVEELVEVGVDGYVVGLELG
jgi:hypothetical protein